MLRRGVFEKMMLGHDLMERRVESSESMNFLMKS